MSHYTIKKSCMVYWSSLGSYQVLCLGVVQRLGGGRGCHKFVPVLGGDVTRIAPPGDLLDQPPGEMSRIRGKLAGHIGDHVVLSPEGIVLMTTSGTESSYPRPPQSLKHSSRVGLWQMFWGYKREKKEE